MSHSTTNHDARGNSPKARGNFPHSQPGRKHRLLKKLAVIGYTAKSFRAKYGITHPDFSHFLYGRKRRIGRKSLRNIRQALIAEGLLTPPKSRPKIPCPTCGRLMRVHELHSAQRLEKWLEKKAQDLRTG